MEELLLKYISGNITAHEKERVVLWINESDANRKEYDALRKMYTAMLWYEEDKEIQGETQKGKATKREFFREFLKIAALLMAALFLVRGWDYLSQQLGKEEVALQQLHVPAGQRVELTLADGTHVWLNANTRLSFPSHFGSDAREITLDGEARFEVKKESKRPFVVKTARHDVRVLGTIFNLFAYDRDTLFEASLLQGSIDVSAHGGDRIQLKPHTKVTSTGRGGMRVTAIENPDYYRWTEGLLCFENETLEVLFNKLEVYFNVKITVNNKQLLERKYGGKFSIDDGIEHIFSVLQLNNAFTYKRNASTNEYIIN